MIKVENRVTPRGQLNDFKRTASSFRLYIILLYLIVREMSDDVRRLYVIYIRIIYIFCFMCARRNNNCIPIFVFPQIDTFAVNHDLWAQKRKKKTFWPSDFERVKAVWPSVRWLLDGTFFATSIRITPPRPPFILYRVVVVVIIFYTRYYHN